MSLSTSSPVTGTAQTGLTSPTYTVVSSSAPDVNGRQYVVTALGGTQTNVSIGSASSPFTTTWWWPKVLRTLQYIAGSGRQVAVPLNSYKLVTRKGVSCHSELPLQTMVVTTTIDVPAGADVNDSEDVRAALSLHIGALSQNSTGIGDTCVSGTP